MTEELNVGNISTIATWLSILLYPIIVGYGIELDQATLTTFIYTLIVIVIAIWSSYNPNTFKFLKNAKSDCSCETEETILNDDYTVDPTGDEQ